MEEKIIRPTTKPEAIKGKLLKYQGTDYCEFMPQAQGEPQYEGISKTRHSQLKRSKGKAPKLVAHLTAQAESIDPYADMMEELGKLFPDNKKGMPKPCGRRLLAEPEQKRADRVARGLDWVKRYSWADHAAGLVKLLEGAA